MILVVAMATEVAIKIFTIIFLVLSDNDHSGKVSFNSEMGPGQLFLVLSENWCYTYIRLFRAKILIHATLCFFFFFCCCMVHVEYYLGLCFKGYSISHICIPGLC